MAAQENTRNHIDRNSVFLTLSLETPEIISDFINCLGENNYNESDIPYKQKDILIGGGNFAHPGNRLLYQLASHHLRLFYSLPIQDNSIVTKGIFTFLDTYNIRFLRYDSAVEAWIQVPDVEAEKTVKHYFIKVFLDMFNQSGLLAT